MNEIKINAERCKGCTLCIEACPKKCLKMSDGFNVNGYHPAVFINEKDCIACGFCYQMCPDVCIEVSGT